MATIITPESLPYVDLRLDHSDAALLIRALESWSHVDSKDTFKYAELRIKVAQVQSLTAPREAPPTKSALRVLAEEAETHYGTPVIPQRKPAPPRKKLTDAQRVAVIARLEAGEGPSSIARSYGVTVGSIAAYRGKAITKFQARTGVGA